MGKIPGVRGTRLQWLSIVPVTLSVAPVCRTQPPETNDLLPKAAATMRFFKKDGLVSLEAIRNIRPPRLPPGIREAIIRRLPTEGELTPTAQERSKLAGIDAVLALHDRTGAVEVKLIDTIQAAVGIHARSVILISRRALNLLTAAEVQALAAHEIGHDYFWEAYELAVARDHLSTARELELRCDGVALLILRVLRGDPHVLASAIGKIDRFNVRFGALNLARYVPAAERIRFQRAFTTIADAAAAAPSGR